jgi:spore coat protein CotH
MKNIFMTMISLLVLGLYLNAQPIFPENGELYIDTVVPRIDITINPDTLAWLYQSENLESDIEFSAQFVFDNGTIRDTVYPVGFRLRGNTSRYSQKKSFKVSFNRFESGGKYFGVEKLNFNGEHNDPSIMRSKVCWDILRKMEVPAPRSNHVQVYINDNYYGLYISVEHIDEEFVKSRFTYNNGNLYKCLWPANLQYLGDDPDLYKFESNGRRAYELKINEEVDDYSDIANFIDVINNTSNTDFVCKTDEAFNVYDYLKVIAADVLFGNWDGYIYNQNNFYLYHNTISDKIEYIPYDLDNTLGVDWIGRDWGTRNMYDWQNHSDYRPLYEKIMDNQELRDQYTNFMYDLVYNLIDLDSLKTSINQRKDMISAFVADDPYYPLDWGYTYNDFVNSLEQAAGGHIDYGLFPYLDTRISSIKDQLETVNSVPVIKYIGHQRLSSSSIQFNAKCEGQYIPLTVELSYEIQDGGMFQEQMFDDGQHNDGEAGDGYYGLALYDLDVDKDLYYQVDVRDDMGLSNILPCDPVIVPAAGGDNYQLYINEFMADNETTIADEHGNYDDWIELYNPEEVIVWLGDKYMTDDLSEPNKWQLPDAYIDPKGFVLIWADDEPDEGPFHATFKLSKDGEEIGLFNNSLETIDEIVFGAQSEDISYGREMDGDDVWIFFEEPTPLASNQTSDVFVVNENGAFTIFPNPSNGGYVQLSVKKNFGVYSLYGQLIESHKNLDFLNTSNYTKGIYLLVSDDGYKQKLIVN